MAPTNLRRYFSIEIVRKQLTETGAIRRTIAHARRVNLSGTRAVTAVEVDRNTIGGNIALLSAERE